MRAQRSSCLLAVSIALTATSCGPSTLQAYLQQDGLAYGASCRGRADAHRKRVEDLAYNPVTLKVLKWPRTLPGGKNATLSESEFLRRLAAGRVRHGLVTARGGVGKSTLARAIESQLCQRFGAFRVDLNKDVAASLSAGKKGNLIMARLEAKLGLSAAAVPEFRALLKRHPHLILLDSLDEVPVAQRAAVVAQIHGLWSAMGDSGQALVFARPAVDGKNYGLKGLDAHVYLPPLTCGRARSTLRWTAKSEDAERRTNHFIKTYHLDRQGKKGDGCYYPFMAAYRDLQVVQREAEKFNPAGGLNALTASLSQVHQSVVAERLLKELSALSWSQDKVLSVIDRVVRQRGRVEGQWNLEFSMTRCLEAVQAQSSDPAQRQYICEKLLQSALFEQLEGSQEWRFGHREVADLFLARWVDREIARTGGSCDVVKHHSKWIGSRDVAGYLVGQTHGSKCLLQVTEALCAATGSFEKASTDLLYKGLPLGAARTQAVQAAQKAAEPLDAGSCVRRTLSAL